jgi:hypothetical protein
VPQLLGLNEAPLVLVKHLHARATRSGKSAAENVHKCPVGSHESQLC